MESGEACWYANLSKSDFKLCSHSADIELKAKDRVVNFHSGQDGEFADYFSKLVPYTRVRLFPLTIEHGEKFQKTIKMPVRVTVKSKVCHASTVLDELPVDPIVLIVTDTKFN